MDKETIYTLEGKVFPRKFHKFGDICLTESNERIFVCNLCKCLSVTATQFWKHQKEEHNIRDYQDIIDNPDFKTKVDETETTQISDDEQQFTKKTRSSDKIQNGSSASPEYKHLAADQQHVHKKRKFSDDDSNHTDSPLLKQALKEAPRAATNTRDQIPRATVEQLYEALNSSCNDDNFNEFISFCCPECGKRFQTDAQWKQHTAAAHNFFAPDQLNISLHKVNPDGSMIYKCDICNVLLNKPNIAPLRRHKLTHMPFKSFCCRLCGTKIRHKSGIVHHMRTVHRKGTETKKPYKCGECYKAFATALLYKKHFSVNPNGGTPCGGHNVNSFALLQDLDTTGDESIGYHNEMSEDGNYDNSFGANLNESSDEDYDPSAFLVTEMTEDGMPNEERSLGLSYDVKIKEEPPEEIIDTAEGYMDLWQEDAALIAEQQMQRRQASIQRINVAAEMHTNFRPAPSSFECAVCCECFKSKLLLKRHLRKHGKNMDCRHCGVKISSIKALRRHLDMNRCKVLTGQMEPLDERRPPDHTDSLLVPRNEYVETVKSPPPTGDTYNCEVCNEPFATEYLLCLHGGRKHGKTDCRLCGVKISTLGALKRHYDWNRCKALK